MKNAGSEEAIEAQVDVVRVARQRLKSNPETCKFQPSVQSRGLTKSVWKTYLADPQFLTIHEAAALLRVSETWVRRHIAELPAIRNGKLIRIDAALLAEQMSLWHDS